MGYIFTSATGLQEHLMKFSDFSTQEFLVNEQTVTVEHTQFAGFSVEKVVRKLCLHTDSNPTERDFLDELENAFVHIRDVVSDRDMQRHLDDFRYIDERDFNTSVMNYQMDYMVDSDSELHSNSSQSREQTIADIVSYYIADKVGLKRTVAMTSYNRDERRRIDCDDSKLVLGMMLDVIEKNGEKAILSKPKPSVDTLKEILIMCDYCDYNPHLKDIYALYCTPDKVSMYLPDDSTDKQVKSSIGEIMAISMGEKTDIERWASENEPPIETLFE